MTRLRTRFDCFALGRLPAGKMNKTEAAYAAQLELRKQDGDVLWYRFEGMKLRLADKTFFTVDFLLMRRDGTIECHEVKGFMTEDANVKIKVAADQYPFKFFLIRKSKIGWKVTPIHSEDQSQESINECA